MQSNFGTDSMTNNEIIEQTKEFVKNLMLHDSTGHDWWHVERVWRMARRLAQEENANSFLVEMTALLHDVDDWKLSSTADNQQLTKANQWLEKLTISPDIIKQINDIIHSMSFKGAQVKSEMQSLEGKIVQDADRLDAIGAVGIARTFAYGGHKNRAMYDPTQKPQQHHSFADYKNNTSPTINHFYEKLLLLKDLMNTETAKKIAIIRHQRLEQFLHDFFEEVT